MAGLYIHIPFCRQKCTYCNFHFSTSLSQKEDLLLALHQELVLQKDFLQSASVETIYFGGGTPSLLHADELKKLFDTIQKNYPITHLTEVTLEANPDDLSQSYLTSLLSTPINRLSIGVQSFNEKDLRFMNRAHTAQQADYAIKSAQDKGFTNLTIDLIYGSPNLSDIGWKNHLHKVKELDIPHFSAYALTVEEGTLLHHNIQKKKTAPLDAEKAAAQFELLMEEAATMNYEHYEISNLAKENNYAIHNTHYWKGIPYLGIGPSAHSFDGAIRRSNIAHNTRYIQALLKDRKLLFEEETLTETNKINEYIMTSLRTMWGCDLMKIRQEFGDSYADELLNKSEKFIDRKWIEHTQHLLTLTRKGKLFADKIASDLFF